jgi:hypothetical protein
VDVERLANNICDALYFEELSEREIIFGLLTPKVIEIIPEDDEGQFTTTTLSLVMQRCPTQAYSLAHSVREIEREVGHNYWNHPDFQFVMEEQNYIIEVLLR